VRDDGPAKGGYIRAGEKNQTPELRCWNLLAFGCEKIFEKQKIPRKEDRPEPRAAIEFCGGDELVVWMLGTMWSPEKATKPRGRRRGTARLDWWRPSRWVPA
jgi:hypothetical protein